MMNNNKSSVMGKLFGNSFYIEVFGIFMPGVVAIGATVLMLAFLFWYATGESLFDMLNVAGSNTAYSIGWVFFIALSYSVGAVIYRRGPKHADYVAAYTQYKRTKKSERSRLAYEFIEIKDNEYKKYGCKKRCWLIMKFFKKCRRYRWIKERSKYNPDFPYPFLRRYLYKRKFFHLVDFVNWCDGFEEKNKEEANVKRVVSKSSVVEIGKGARSKQAVNIIKHRLNALGESKISDDISRNESHIRLMSSLWYVMRYVKFISLMSLVLLVAMGSWIFIKHINNISNANHDVVPSINISMEKQKFHCYSDVDIFECNEDSIVEKIELFVAMVVVFLGVFFMARKIRKDVETSIHYVRIRELLSILEGAWVYDNKLRPNYCPELFDDITKAGREFGEKFCQKCEHYDKCCPQYELKEKV